MVKISVNYEGELHCSATHEPSGTVLATDAPVDNQGRGESFSPTDLCATALASCMATIMGIKARSLGIELAGMVLSVEKHMTTTAPRRIASLPVTINLPAALNLTEEQQQTLLRSAKSCPVHHSLHPEIEKPITLTVS